MDSSKLPRSELIKMILGRIFGVILVSLAVVFLPAGTFAYWEAWLYLGILFIPMFFALLYLIKNEPDLLERRMRMREKQAEQKQIIKTSYVFFILAFLLPGLDRRFEWSDVPVSVVIITNVLILLGYIFVFLVFRENRYASRIVEVEQDQQVISSGPYAIVRHPMYLGVILMYALSPLALGSYWGMIFSLLIVPILVARIRSEEALLHRELEGYREYTQKVKYRLIPGVW